MAKRIIDHALDAKDEAMSIILLDWAKAFDKIRPEAMLRALERFGIPVNFFNMVRGIYSDRTFASKNAASHPALDLSILESLKGALCRHTCSSLFSLSSSMILTVSAQMTQRHSYVELRNRSWT